MGQVRLLPLLALAAICLFALKLAGLVFDGGYILTGSAPARAEISEPKNKEEGDPARQTPQPADPEPAKTAEPRTPPDGPDAPVKTAVPVKPGAAPAAVPQGAELEVLQSLAERRKALARRARELQLRENLLKAAEQRIEKRITELKEIEQRIETELKKRDDVRKAEYDKLVILYSRMKPKQAAEIFNRMDLDVLTAIVRRMKPRTMSAIFAAMKPSVAERVTIEIAKRARPRGPAPEALPKITSQIPK